MIVETDRKVKKVAGKAPQVGLEVAAVWKLSTWLPAHPLCAAFSSDFRVRSLLMFCCSPLLAVSPRVSPLLH